MKELRIEAAVDRLDEVLAFIDAELEAQDCSMKAQMQIDVAAEEMFVNIASYAYAPNQGDARIQIETDPDTRVFSVTLIDSGIPYDPLKKADPDVTLSAEERGIGGLGIYMVKKSMDAVSYRHENGQNIFRMEKKI